jgi:hypothetical protein
LDPSRHKFPRTQTRPPAVLTGKSQPVDLGLYHEPESKASPVTAVAAIGGYHRADEAFEPVAQPGTPQVPRSTLEALSHYPDCKATVSCLRLKLVPMGTSLPGFRRHAAEFTTLLQRPHHAAARARQNGNISRCQRVSLSEELSPDRPPSPVSSAAGGRLSLPPWGQCNSNERTPELLRGRERGPARGGPLPAIFAVKDRIQNDHRRLV